MTRFVRTPPLDMLALQRHMLSQMGIGFWVGKQTSSTAFDPLLYVRQKGGIVAKEKTKEQESLKQPPQKQETPQSKPLPQASSEQPILEVDIQQKNSVAVAQMPPQVHIAPQAIQASSLVQSFELPKFLAGLSVQIERFGLFGVRYGNWVLIVDEVFLNPQTYALWTALVDALKKQNPSTLSLHIGYPLVANDYPEYQHYHQGTMVLLGFLIRLCYDVERTPLQVAFLTSVSQGLEFGALWAYAKKQDLPTLDQIAHNPAFKHRLWQHLHS